MTSGWRKLLWKTLGDQFNISTISDCVLIVAGVLTIVIDVCNISI